MSFSELPVTGPGTPPGLPPARCTCTLTHVATLEATLRCPFGWYELPDGSWQHTWRLK